MNVANQIATIEIFYPNHQFYKIEWLNLAKATFLLIFYPLAEANDNDRIIHCRPHLWDGIKADENSEALAKQAG